MNDALRSRPWTAWQLSRIAQARGRLDAGDAAAVDLAIEAILKNPYDPPGFRATVVGARSRRRHFRLAVTRDTYLLYEAVEQMPPSGFKIILFWALLRVVGGEGGG